MNQLPAYGQQAWYACSRRSCFEREKAAIPRAHLAEHECHIFRQRHAGLSVDDVRVSMVQLYVCPPRCPLCFVGSARGEHRAGSLQPVNRVQLAVRLVLVHASGGDSWTAGESSSAQTCELVMKQVSVLRVQSSELTMMSCLVAVDVIGLHDASTQRRARS